MSLVAQNSSQIINQQLAQPVTIKNAICPKDTVYRKYFINHYPANFTIYVNGQKLSQNTQMQITGKTFKVIYAYEWNPPWGKIERAKEVTFQVTDPQKIIDLGFKSWDDTYRVHATNAQPLSTQETSLTQLLKK
jgi:hypothetical protein